MKLKGTVSLITGGGRGIGEAVALACAREGSSVILASRTLSEVESVAEEIQKSGGRASARKVDVADMSQVGSLIDSIIREHGRVDVLVNSAGIYGPIGPFLDVDLDEWKTAIDVNLYGVLHCVRAVLPHMVKQKSGKIVNFGGGGAASPLPRFSAYGISKAALVRFTETVAEEIKPFGIRMNIIAPGAVDTRLQDEVLKAGDRAGALYERILGIREGKEKGFPRETVAKLTVFLASDESAPLTGKLIAAPHDGWERWDRSRIEQLMKAPWFTLRRIDPATLTPLVPDLSRDNK